MFRTRKRNYTSIYSEAAIMTDAQLKDILCLSADPLEKSVAARVLMERQRHEMP